MNDKKISFISAVNDDIQYQQCLLLINSLNIPKGFTIETIPIKNATSMCNAYNEGMLLSDAKYKVYLHQDAFILNLDFIQNIIDIFNLDSSIGIIGMCGAKTLPPSGIWWDSADTMGKIYEKNGSYFGVLGFREVEKEYEEVESIDGLIIITQYDIEWRSDIFDGWHFYDISQSKEFKMHDYKTVVPKQITPWCMHTRGYTDMNIYELYRLKFINTYKI
ncbi:MAG: glycosyltransferase family protein [Romboutsia sp.]|uniref:glycosyltransferase family protein n=1 Tax=Romboutsia sp. TaxID=1965302 RepID=UPI003F37F753